MESSQSLEEFYRDKLDWLPGNLKKEMGHFNVFRLSDVLGKPHGPMPYRRIDFYKVSFMTGHNRISYADRILELNGPALVFSNPLIPYKWEHDEETSGYFCIFT